MKTPALLLATIALLGAGCSSSPQTSTTAQGSSRGNAGLAEEDRAVSDRTGDTPKRSDAEATLGIALPPDTGILSSINGARAVAVSGRTSLTVMGTSAFLTAELAKAGYQPGRLWGVSPTDNATTQSATFRGNNENWSITVKSEGSMTTFEIQVQR